MKTKPQIIFIIGSAIILIAIVAISYFNRYKHKTEQTMSTSNNREDYVTATADSAASGYDGAYTGDHATGATNSYIQEDYDNFNLKGFVNAMGKYSPNESDEIMYENSSQSSSPKYISIKSGNDLNVKREDLQGIKTVMKTFDGKKNAGITIPGFGGITLGKNETNLNVYYLESKKITYQNKEVLVGIGFSIHYLVKRLKKGLDLNNMKNVAASVQLGHNQSQVYYSMQTYGIAGPELVKYFKPVVDKDFDIEGFNIMQNSIDGILKIISGETPSPNVRYTPVIIPDQSLLENFAY